MIRLICELPDEEGVELEALEKNRTIHSRSFEDAIHEMFPRSEGYRPKIIIEAVEPLSETFPERGA